MAYALCRDLTPASYPAIAAHYGYRDHSTIVHGAAAHMQRVRNEENVCRAHCQIHRSIKAADNLEFRSVRGGA
jgi:chromosomal replication initiation ATPase DnaA